MAELVCREVSSPEAQRSGREAAKREHRRRRTVTGSEMLAVQNDTDGNSLSNTRTPEGVSLQAVAFPLPSLSFAKEQQRDKCTRFMEFAKFEEMRKHSQIYNTYTGDIHE